MKNYIILILTIFLIISLYLLNDNRNDDSEITETSIIYDTIKEVVYKTKPSIVEKVYIKVPVDKIKYDTINNIVYKTKEDLIEKEIKTNKYVFNDTIKSAILKSTIIADKIFSRDIEFTSFNKYEKSKTIITKYKSQLYFGGSVTLGANKSVLNTSLNAFYTYKNKSLIGLGVGYYYNKPSLTISFAKKF